jgi:flagellar protein FliL
MSEKPPETLEKPRALPVALGGANLLVACGILALLVLRPAPGVPPGAPAAEPSAPSEPAAGPAVGPTVKLADFVVHLRDPERERYARVSMELELRAESDRERFAPYVPRLRDAFLGYLSDRTAEDVAGSEALARTKAELLKRSEEIVPGKPVRALYFTDFVVQ